MEWERKLEKKKPLFRDSGNEGMEKTMEVFWRGEWTRKRKLLCDWVFYYIEGTLLSYWNSIQGTGTPEHVKRSLNPKP